MLPQTKTIISKLTDWKIDANLITWDLFKRRLIGAEVGADQSHLKLNIIEGTDPKTYNGKTVEPIRGHSLVPITSGTKDFIYSEDEVIAFFKSFSISFIASSNFSNLIYIFSFCSEISSVTPIFSSIKSYTLIASLGLPA